LSDGISRAGNLSTMWSKAQGIPLGKSIFSWILGRTARYTGTIGAKIEHLEHGRGVATMRDTARVRNHLKSVHAIALMNLGELATGATVMYQVDGRGRGILKGIGMKYHKKARGLITATCEFEAPVEPGKYDLEVEGSLTDTSGELVATVNATWRIDIF
jgi:acyl-coenzyme A thioesterase PaaI-like protein